MATRHLAVPLAVDAVEPRPRETSPPLIHVLRPRLPSASELLPYLQEIDQARWYSNGGPLVTRLERELSRHFGLPNLGVVTAANCTLGLTAVLLAREVRPGSLCLMPSWTFAATPHAARAAGLVPFFHDVDQRTWALDPNAVRETLKRQASPIGAVMVVSPFGAPIDLHAWEKFEDDTGVPVVVDAAAGFDTARPSRIPSVVSLHATKILGAGEGGFIITADPRLRESHSVLQLRLHGFAESYSPGHQRQDERIPRRRRFSQPFGLAADSCGSCRGGRTLPAGLGESAPIRLRPGLGSEHHQRRASARNQRAYHGTAARIGH